MLQLFFQLVGNISIFSYNIYILSDFSFVSMNENVFVVLVGDHNPDKNVMQTRWSMNMSNM